MKNVICFFSVFFVLSCSPLSCTNMREDMSTEQVLQEYLNIAFNMEKPEQKKLLLEYTTGPLRQAILQATPDSFREAYLIKRYKLKSFSILGKEELTPKNTKITYLLEYWEKPEKAADFDTSALVSTENRILMKKENGRWYIENVDESKTLFNLPDSPINK